MLFITTRSKQVRDDISQSLSAEDLADTIRANDPLRESPKIIRGLLLQENFDSQDKFCDAHDLEES